MSSFEYVMVFVSIIMGLAVANLLRGTVYSLRAGSPAKPGLIHSLWVAQLLVANVSLWALRWNGEPREDWPGGVLLAFLAMPIGYYALSEFIFPAEGLEVDLTEHFLDNRLTFFCLYILLLIAGTFGPRVFYGELPSGWWVGLTPVPVFSFFIVSKNRALHLAFAAVMLLASTWGLTTLRVG